MRLDRSAALAVALVVLVSLAQPGPAPAQDWRGRGRMQGQVKDEQGNPIEGARVSAALAESGQGTTATTNKKGQWAIGGLRGGKWNLDIEAVGYVTRKLEVQIQEMGAGPNVEAKMVRGAAASAEPAAGAAASDPRAERLRAELEQANKLLQEGRWAEARAAYEPVAAELPELLDVQRSIAYAFYKEGNLEAAAERMRAVVAKDPSSQENRLLLVNVLLDKGDVDGAVTALADVDEAAVSDPAVFLNIGILFFNRQKVDEAALYFDKVIARDPKGADAWYYRGLCQLSRKKLAEAKADAQKYLELAPPDAPFVAAARELLKVK